MKKGQLNYSLGKVILVIILAQKYRQNDIASMLGMSRSIIKLMINGRTRRSKQAWEVLRELQSLLQKYEQN